MSFIKDRKSDTVTIPMELYGDLLLILDGCAHHSDDAIRKCDRMTSGNFMHDKSYVREILRAKKEFALRRIEEFNLEDDIKATELPYVVMR